MALEFRTYLHYRKTLIVLSSLEECYKDNGFKSTSLLVAKCLQLLVSDSTERNNHFEMNTAFLTSVNQRECGGCVGDKSHSVGSYQQGHLTTCLLQGQGCCACPPPALYCTSKELRQDNLLKIFMTLFKIHL